MADELRSLIESADRILITAHISPDPDAISSVSLLNQALSKTYPDKKVAAVLEEEPSGLDFIGGYQDLKFGPVYEQLQAFKPNLFILLDGNNYERVSRQDGQKIRDYIKTNGIATVIIDHHEELGKDDVDVFINNQSPACAQDVYEIGFNELGLSEPAGAAQIAMVGFYADTGGFIYMKAGQQDLLFDFAKTLVGKGAKVEKVKNQLETYSKDDLKVLQELMANIQQTKDYSYSYLADSFVDAWLASGNSQAQLQKGTNLFLNDYIRNIEGRAWGFITYKNTLEGTDRYSVSFRAQGGTQDVAAIAVKLGGGGHKPAAGAKIDAKSASEAIASVKEAIQLVE